MTGSSSNKKKIKTDKGSCKHQRQSLCQRSRRTCCIVALFPHWGPMHVLASRKQRHLREVKPSTSSSNLSCRLCRSFWLCLWSLSQNKTLLGIKLVWCRAGGSPLPWDRCAEVHLSTWDVTQQWSYRHGFCQVPVRNMPMDMLHLALKCLLGCLIACLRVSF